jgi:hypothetical protein
MSQWQHILTPAELDARRAMTASLDPRFARQEHEFYATRTATQLDGLAHGAWLANDPDGYQMARSYRAQL